MLYARWTAIRVCPKKEVQIKIEEETRESEKSDCFQPAKLIQSATCVQKHQACVMHDSKGEEIVAKEYDKGVVVA